MREWREFEHLSELQCLEDLVFIGNPLEEEATVNGNYTQQVSKLHCTSLYCTVLHCTALCCTVLHYSVLYCTVQVSKRLLLLKKLDGYPIIREEEGDGEDENVEDDNSDDSDFDDVPQQI